MSVAIIQLGAPVATAAASNTTTTIAVSDSSPSIGDLVTFTVTVTPATFSSVGVRRCRAMSFDVFGPVSGGNRAFDEDFSFGIIVDKRRAEFGRYSEPIET